MFVLSPLTLFLPYFAVKYGQQVKEISKSSKYCHCYILKWQKVLNHGIKQSDAILKIQYSGGTGTSSWLVSKMTSKRQESNDSVNKCTLPIQNTNIISYLLQYYFCLLNFVRPFLGCHFFFFCWVNGVENGLSTCDQAVLLLFLFGRRKWKLRTPDRRLWVINPNCFIHSSFGVISWMWITFTLWLTGNQFTSFHSLCRSSFSGL